MDPRTLVTDVGHLEQVGIKPGKANGVLKQRLVGDGRARGHNHTVQLQVLDLLDDVRDSVLRAGIQVILCVNNACQ